MNILIVDDLTVNRRLLRAVLEAEGLNIHEAVDGIEALAVLHRETVDAVISDILMPRMDGYRLCREIRANQRLFNTPFIFYTATYTSPGDEKLSLEIGANKYLKKPASASVLMESLREVVAAKKQSTPKPAASEAELEVMKNYNERLVSKLEEKNIELLVHAAAVEAAANSIVITDTRGHIVFVNPAFTKLTGYSADEVLGKTPRVLKSGEHDKGFYRDLWQTILSNQTWSGEFTNRRKDGSLYFGEQTITPVSSQDGTITHFIGIMNDVTARKRAEQELRESERRFSDMMGKVELISLMLDREARITYSNDYLLRLTGWRRDEVLGRNWFELFIPPESQSVKAVFDALIADQPSAWHHENQIMTRSGERRIIQWNNSVLRSGSGEVIGTASIGEDITDRKRSEEALRESEAKFRQLAENINEVFWIVDTKTKQVLYVSPAYETIWGRTCESLYQSPRNWLEAIHRDDRQSVLQAVETKMVSGGYNETYRIVRPDGSRRWIRDRGFPICDSAGQAYRIVGTAEDITDRIRADEEIRRTTTLLRAVADGTEDAVFVKDAQGRYLLFNEAASRFVGKPATEVIGRDDTSLFDPEGARQVMATDLQVRESGLTQTSEEQLTAAGVTRIYLATKAPYRDAAGNIIGTIGISHDITERKRVEQQIADESAYIRTMLSASPMGMLTYVASGECVSANEAAARLIGASVEQLKHQNFRTIASWKTYGLLEFALHALQTNTEQSREIHVKTTFGKDTWLAWRFVPFHYRNQQHLMVLFSDVAPEKLAEQQLRESEERNRHLVDDAIDIIFTIDPQRVLTSLNPAFESITGFRRAEWLGREFPPIVHPDDLPLASLKFEKVMNGDKPMPFQLRIKKAAQGYVNLEFTVTPQFQAGKVTTLLGIARDITERNQLELQLRESQKMEAIGQLAGGIAHDFNNILGAIMGYTELARMETEGNTAAQECLDAVGQASVRAKDLVQQILAFSRRQEHSRNVTQLKHIVREALKLLRASVPSTIEFSTKLNPVRTVLADPTSIHQVVMNLGTNAWHAMRDKPGKLTVELADIEVDEDFARTRHDLRVGRYVRLSVSDTGCGMDQATQARIFEPFFTTKRQGEGTGLGLAVVHGVMKSHDGAISVYSHLGEGTRFDLFFPAFESEPEELQQAAPIPRGNGEQILVVDDEVPLVEVGKKMLERLGYAVTTSTNPIIALELFKASPEKFDLVITDYAMPGMNGLALAAEILKVRRDIPILLTTGFSGTMTPEKVRELGLRDLVIKPNTARSLGEAIARVFSKS